MANPDASLEKPVMRRRAREAVATLSPESRQNESGALCRAIASWLASQPHISPAATFSALPDEPDLRELHALCPDIDWCYPLVHADGELSFHRVEDPASLSAGRFGILEPDPERHPAVAIAEMKLILCPGQAFSPDGTRLGRGKGHYDRVLADAVDGIARVGVSFSVSRFERLPREAHDVAMTHLVTASGVDELV